MRASRRRSEPLVPLRMALLQGEVADGAEEAGAGEHDERVPLRELGANGSLRHVIPRR